MGLRVNRYSWWTHWRELADYLLPRRYKWIITPNQMARGSPINQHILDNAGTLSARDCGAGIMFGVTDPARPWFGLQVGRIDSTQTSPVSLWLAEVERIMMLIFHESNFYTALAVAYFDLVVFGTCVVLIYEDFENVINCINPCLGEFYLDNDKDMKARIFYREFTLTVDQVVGEFGLSAVSPTVARLWREGGSSLTRELVVAHAIEPNDDGRAYGIPSHFAFRELYWEWGGSASPQGGSSYAPGWLRKRGFHEQIHMPGRWDLVSNDAYGRSPGMDALPDVKQLQLETKRKAQAIDKLVNPPMVADIQLKNQPASLLPGGVTYVSGMMSQGRPGFAPVYTVEPPVKEISEDLMEVRERIEKAFYVPLFKIISQYETRSNVTAVEIDARRAEGMIMLGPVLTRLHNEFLAVAIDRTFAIAARAGILPPAPAEIQGKAITVKYVSMLQLAQQAASAGGIERVMSMVGNLAGVDPQAMDNVDFDYGIEKYSSLVNNDPRLIRSPTALAQIRQQRQQQQAQEQKMQQSMAAVQGAKLLSETDTGAGKNALQRMSAGGGLQ